MHVAYMAWHALHAHGRECCYMGHMGQHEQHDHQHDAMWNFLRRQERCEEREEYMIWRGGSGGHRVLGGLGYPALPSCLRSPRLSLARVRQAAASVPRRAEAGVGRTGGVGRADGQETAGGAGPAGIRTRACPGHLAATPLWPCNHSLAIFSGDNFFFWSSRAAPRFRVLVFVKFESTGDRNRRARLLKKQPVQNFVRLLQSNCTTSVFPGRDPCFQSSGGTN